MQGTKVLEDREIRFSFRILAEDAPPQHGFSGITKYTGSLAAPEWEDVEPGRVLSFPGTLVKISQVQKTSSKRCAMSWPTSPALRTDRISRLQGKKYTVGTTK